MEKLIRARNIMAASCLLFFLSFFSCSRQVTTGTQTSFGLIPNVIPSYRQDTVKVKPVQRPLTTEQQELVRLFIENTRSTPKDIAYIKSRLDKLADGNETLINRLDITLGRAADMRDAFDAFRERTERTQDSLIRYAAIADSRAIKAEQMAAVKIKAEEDYRQMSDYIDIATVGGCSIAIVILLWIGWKNNRTLERISRNVIA